MKWQLHAPLAREAGEGLGGEGAYDEPSTCTPSPAKRERGGGEASHEVSAPLAREAGEGLGVRLRMKSQIPSPAKREGAVGEGAHDLPSACFPRARSGRG